MSVWPASFSAARIVQPSRDDAQGPRWIIRSGTSEHWSCLGIVLAFIISSHNDDRIYVIAPSCRVPCHIDFSHVTFVLVQKKRQRLVTLVFPKLAVYNSVDPSLAPALLQVRHVAITCTATATWHLYSFATLPPLGFRVGTRVIGYMQWVIPLGMNEYK